MLESFLLLNVPKSRHAYIHIANMAVGQYPPGKKKVHILVTLQWWCPILHTDHYLWLIIVNQHCETGN